PAPETPPSAAPGTPGALKTESAPAPPPAKTEAAPETPPEKAKSDTPAKGEPPKAEAPKAEPAKASPKAAAVKLSDDEVAEIKKLPESEQAAALKQAVCPVSDEPLGSMGMPVKVSAEGKTFYLCCKNCKKEVDADPKAVLAKLGK